MNPVLNHYLAPGRHAKYCDEYVCLCVRSRNSNTTLIFMHVACGHGSVLLWRRCYTLCTSGLVGPWDQPCRLQHDVTFQINSPGSGIPFDVKQLHCLVEFTRMRHRGRNLPSTTDLFVSCALQENNTNFYCRRLIFCKCSNCPIENCNYKVKVWRHFGHFVVEILQLATYSHCKVTVVTHPNRIIGLTYNAGRERDGSTCRTSNAVQKITGTTNRW